ncbi:MAG: hypothetical protein LBU07_07065, partial [Coriobacteriales bacterium]|jgi:hypothetical protein|nr:hypothetical protein [Coriobacteriales bacterium]
VIDSLFTGPHKVWTEKDSLEDFFARRSNMSSSVRFEAWLTSGLSDDEYINLIADMKTELADMVCAVVFEVSEGDKVIYFYNIYSNNVPLDMRDEIVRNIESHRRRTL